MTFGNFKQATNGSDEGNCKSGDEGNYKDSDEGSSK